MTLAHLLRNLAILLAAALLGAGCGGVNGSYGVSPASFFLPGLMQNAPTGPSPLELSTNLPPDSILAQLR
jgi:hypothetical protein